MSVPPTPVRGLALVFALTFLFTAAYGVGKLYWQRSNRPDFARTQANQYEGFVAIDDYATRAELIAAWMRGEGELEAVFAKARSGFHPASLLVPCAVALLSFVVPSIPLAFAALASAALLGAALVARRLALRLDPSGGAATGWIAASLVVGHCLSMRTSAQLQMDPFCHFQALVALVFAVRWSEQRRATDGVALFLVLASGLFVKISLLPLLALPSLVGLVRGRFRAWKQPLVDGLRFGVLPAATWLAGLFAIGAIEAGFADMHDQATQFRIDLGYLRLFGTEMLLLFQAFPLVALVWLRGRGRELDVATARVVWLALGLVLLATWGFRFPHIARIYLPLVGMLAVLAAPCLRRLRHPLGWLTAFVVANASLSLYGLLG